MTVHINTFPVAQKTLYSISRKTKEDLASIIPLMTRYEGEYFIGVEDVSDSYGKLYKPLPYTTGQKDTRPGTYSIKRGGVERFDKRNAGEYMERLINLLRDETAAFSSLDTDRLRSIIGDMQEGLKQLEIRYNDSPVREFSIPDYLLLSRDRNDEAEVLFAEYWSTHCGLSNGLRSGKILAPSASLPLTKDSCRLMGMTRGGKSPADVSGRMDAFRYVLTSRDQLVTQEDIVNFFRYELGEKITRVDVRRGVIKTYTLMDQTKATVIIEKLDSKPLEFVRLELEQCFYDHHRLKIILDLKQMGENVLASPMQKTSLVNEKVIIDIWDEGGKATPYTFSGLITDVQIELDKGDHGLMYICAASPTIELERGRMMQTFSDTSLTQIIDEVATDAHFSIVKKPKYTADIKFSMQYKETDFQYLKRLAWMYGEKFVYLGEDLVFGEYNSPLK
jgi:hypothetical protein